MAVATQISVPAQSDRWFGLGVAIAAGAPIYFGNGEAVDLGSCLVVIGFGVALGLVVLLARRAVQVAHHFISRMVGMTAYALIFAWTLPQPAVQQIELGWRVMIPLALGAITWLVILTVAMMIERRLPYIVEINENGFAGDLNVFVSLDRYRRSLCVGRTANRGLGARGCGASFPLCPVGIRALFHDQAHLPADHQSTRPNS